MGRTATAQPQPAWARLAVAVLPLLGVVAGLAAPGWTLGTGPTNPGLPPGGTHAAAPARRAALAGLPSPAPGGRAPLPTTTPSQAGQPAERGTAVDAAASSSPAMADRGLTLWTWTPDGYSTASSDAALSAIASLGANQVVLVPTWFQDGAHADCFAPDPDFTPSDASVVHAMRQAHRLGLAVTIKPQLNLTNGGWRGYIQPADPAAWFGCYARFLDHYAALAQANGATRLVIGTELAGVSPDTAGWQRLIAGARERFHGLLTYGALPFEYSKISFWGSLDEIGVDAYWPLATAPTTDVARLRAAWAPIAAQLAATSARWRRPVLFTEAGYASQVGTATDPSSWTLSDTPAPAQQAAAYQALLASFAGKPWFAGVDWWAWRATDDSPGLDFTPQGKPAAQVLRHWWAPLAG